MFYFKQTILRDGILSGKSVDFVSEIEHVVIAKDNGALTVNFLFCLPSKTNGLLGVFPGEVRIAVPLCETCEAQCSLDGVSDCGVFREKINTGSVNGFCIPNGYFDRSC